MHYYINYQKKPSYSLRITLVLMLSAFLFPLSAIGAIPPPSSMPDYGIEAAWGTDLDEAIGRAQISLKPILLFFMQPNCLECYRIKSYSLKNESLQPLLKKVERVEIDLSGRPELAMIFRIQEIPSLLVIEPDGRLRGHFKGYMTAKELSNALDLILSGNAILNDLDLLLETLKTGDAAASDWRKAMLAMADSEARKKILGIAGDISSGDQEALFKCLTDDLLAVRLGALEFCEEITGEISGFDPWADQQSIYPQEEQQKAIKYWQVWSKSGKSISPANRIMTRKKFDRALQDLIGEDRNRSRYAQRSLSNGKNNVAAWLAAYLDTCPDISENALRRIKEVQYSMVIPTTTGLDPLTTAHRLIWGNQDVQALTIRQLADCGLSVFPLLVDLLTHPEPVIREAAIETLFSSAGNYAVKPIEQHLERETDPDILFIILKHLGDTKSRESFKILESFFTHENEDLVIAAIGGAVKLSVGSLATKLIPLLKDPQWRVRVAALEAIKEKGGHEADFLSQIRGRDVFVRDEIADAVFHCLDDPDEFVRHTAAVTIGEMKINNAESPLKKAYRKHVDMHGVVVSVLLELGMSIPGSYIKDLFGPDRNDLLFVLDRLEKINGNNRSLVHRACESKNPDIACTALRIMAGTEKRRNEDNALLIQAIDSNEPEKQLTVIQEFDMDSDKRKSFRLAMKKSTLPPKKTGLIKTNSDEDILYAVARIMEDTLISGSVRDDAMVLLCGYGHPGAFKMAERLWPELMPSKRSQVAGSFSYYGKIAIPLFKKALSDNNATVWEAALDQLSDSEENVFTKPLSQYLLSPDSRLHPSMIWPRVLDFLCSKSPQQMVPFADQVMENIPAYRSDLVILALSIYTYAGITKDAEKTVLGLSQNIDPFIRRAAWMALTSTNQDKLYEYMDRISTDPSKYVREIVPALLYDGSYKKELDLYFSEDECLSGYDGIRISPAERDFYGDKNKLKEEAVLKLKTMIDNDRDRLIRYRCMITLLSHHKPYDLNKVVSAGQLSGNPHAVARIMEDFFNDHGSYLGKNFAVLLPLLQTPDGKKYGEYEVKKFREQWGIAEQYQHPPEIAFTAIPRQEPREAIMAVFYRSIQ
jgi:HEAT repeat protein/thioredoxin-related protein